MTEEVIFSYTRQEAIADGVLVPVETELFKFPAVITQELHAVCARGDGKEEATYKARVWDVFYMLSAAIRAQKPEPSASGSRVGFLVIVGRRTLSLVGHLGPGDTGEPVITVGFPSDF